MRTALGNLLAALAFCAFIPNTTQGQAHVNENQSTYIYVDANNGSDRNSGTQAAPLKTISAGVAKAVLNNTKGIGTRVEINPGVYREFVDLNPVYNETGATMTFEAVQPGNAIVAGSDVYTGWSPDSGNSSIYNHYWGYNFGQCDVPPSWPTGIQPIVLRREMAFVNGAPMTQVLSKSSMVAGTFYVNESANEISIWPPAGTNISTATVELAVRPQTLEISQQKNIVVRGLWFKHANSCINTVGANILSSNNVLVDNVHADWNNWGGITVSTSTNITVQNSTASYNGGVGISGFQTKYGLYQNNESDYNNWRGAMGALYDWGMGGTKLMRMHGATVNGQKAYRNHAQGLWFDTDNKNITINGAILTENQLASLQIEANEGPVKVQNSSMCSGGVGINVINSSGLTITGNNMYNNGGYGKYQAEIYLGGKSGGRAITDWETHQPYLIFTDHTTIQNNIMEDGGSGQLTFGTFLGGADWTAFAGTLNSNYNYWYDAGNRSGFGIPGGKKTDFPGWRSYTGEDPSSNWTHNSGAAKGCSVPPPAYPDFAVYTDNRSYTMNNGLGTINLRIRSFSYGSLTLSVSGLPYGVTGSFSVRTLTSGNSVLTLRANRYAQNATVPVTITGTSGSRVHTATVWVTVTAGSSDFPDSTLE